MFRGRAIKTLIEGLPQKSWEDLIECPYEDLEGGDKNESYFLWNKRLYARSRSRF